MKKILLVLGTAVIALSMTATSFAQEFTSKGWSIGGAIGNNPSAKPICRRGCKSYESKVSSANKKFLGAQRNVSTTQGRLAAAQAALIDDKMLVSARTALDNKELAFDAAKANREAVLADYIATHPGLSTSSRDYMRLEAALERKVDKAERAVTSAERKVNSRISYLDKKFERAETNAEKAAAKLIEYKADYNSRVRSLMSCKDEYDDECDGPAWSIGGGIGFR